MTELSGLLPATLSKSLALSSKAMKFCFTLAIPLRTSGSFREDDIHQLRKDHGSIPDLTQALRMAWTTCAFIQLTAEWEYKIEITKARLSFPRYNTTVQA